MHVQMFTHRHLQMQGHLDTIVLRTTSDRPRSVGPAGLFAPHTSPIEWETMSYSWGGPGRPSAAQESHDVVGDAEVKVADSARRHSRTAELGPSIGVWGRLVARRRPAGEGRGT